ncbi:hypothetical protein BD410DRAFT_493727 [Rickenella mellea]|uniref:Uncharacterized protein n=1 Tax=Rickenella mellea TaxID=50990 RepID=A0A4Y7PU69_9AGAM|nr:hypothetical protein BD410DRAFT_493727 [Rickenella mellea]
MIYNVGFSGSMFNVCVGVSYLETWGLWLVQVPIQIILSLRTFAVWHRDRRVAALLLLCASGYYITIIVCSIKLTKTNHFIRNPLIDALHECYSDVVLTESLTLSKWAFGTLMFFDGVMFLLILSKAIMTDRKFRARILNILLRDGTIYYTVIFGINPSLYFSASRVENCTAGISFANVLLATTLSAQRGILAISVSNALLAAQSIGASNIVLSLRKFSSQAQLAPTRWQSNSGIGVRIAGRPTLVDELTPQNATDATESIEL